MTFFPRSPLFPIWLLASSAFAQPGAPTQTKVSFAKDIAPIISSKCYHCHGQDAQSRKAHLRLDLREEALKSRDGSRAIVPGKPEESSLLERILSKDQDEVMPPPKEGHAVTPEETALIRKWILQGAEYEGHWAFRAPIAPPIPALTEKENGRNPIDHFIAAALRTSGLSQAPESEPHLLIRRLSLDLIGLPPTPEETQAFMADPAPDRWERAIDRLLASPHFGEKWARPWLDLARYADSTGYGSDMLRLNIWPYRDWVIQALNANLPFDQFSTEQIAGDLLPNASREQIVATAFHRNTMTQNEGGTDDEEYRVAAVKDRVATTMQGWMGLTAGCAQCHSHKFDPISQKEYYQLFSIFNQTEDADRADESPLLPLPTPEQSRKEQQLQSELSALEAEIRRPHPEIDQEQARWENLVRPEVPWKNAPVSKGSSRNGPLRLEDDGTLSLTSRPAQTETYTVYLDASATPVSALRLEIIEDPNTPDLKGHFRLTELTVETLGPKPTKLPLAHASASFEQNGSGPDKAVDGNSQTGWIVPVQTPHAAAFEFAQPASGPLKLTLKMEDSRSPVITRFRLSLTSQPSPVRELPATIRAIVALDPSQRDSKQHKALADFFRPQSKVIGDLTAQITAKKAELASNKPVAIPIMKEAPGMRKTFILNKGNYLTPGEEVNPALPSAFHHLSTSTPHPPANRLTLAHWIFAPENPLTARVAVNRFWSQLFGIGLVETEEDFGTQGSWPSHPELLDWLAVHFQTPKAQGGLGWDTKALLKLLVSSHTYRQDSRASALAQQKDPRNLLLSHYTRRRLEAEAIRDQALFVSGLMGRRIGGPSVYPPQPDGLWTIAFRGSEKYPTSTGEDRWRRSLYTVWRRIAPNPTMATFDAPTRESCTLRRVPTNTPLQAFVTLNDPVYVEAAQGLARRILREAPIPDEARLRYGLQLVLQRPPSPTQLEALSRLLNAELTHYRNDPEASKKLASSAELPIPTDADPAQLAAWTAVSNVLLNLDGFLTKS